MQDRPTARELLATLTTFFEHELLPSLSGPLQYRVRVAANLVKILERELELGPEHDATERRALVELLVNESDSELAKLNARLTEAIVAGRFDGDPEPLWFALMTVTRNKLAVVKPGYDSYDGSVEST
jgi:hypothetical protein